MTLSTFNTSFNEACCFLGEINLLKSKGIKFLNKDDVSQEFKSMSQKNDYFNLYRCAIKNFDYDFLLYDDSIFQFSFKILQEKMPSIRFAFFQNPSEFKTYTEYLEHLRGLNIVTTESDEDIGDSLFEEYQQYLTEQSINSSSICIRYDVDAKNYSPLIHSTAHFHIGHVNNIRIPCDRILTPFKFVLFVIKHAFYHKWKDLIESNNKLLMDQLITAKSKCINLKSTHWTTHEAKELFIS
jgi:hypothetical protein